MESMAFVRKYIDSFLEWELIILFHFNPGIREEDNGIARLVGRNQEDVRKTLKKMCEKGLVQGELIDGKDFYFYNPTIELKNLISNFIEGLSNYETRISLISEILNK